MPHWAVLQAGIKTVSVLTPINQDAPLGPAVLRHRLRYRVLTPINQDAPLGLKP